MLTRSIGLTGKDLSLWRLLYILIQRREPEYCNFTYFLHAADKPCPMLRRSTVIVVNDDYTPVSYIRSIFGRFAYCYMFENSLGYWRSARIAQLVRFQTANQEVSGSILGLVEGWTLSDLLSPHCPWTGTLSRWSSRSPDVLSGDFLKSNPHIWR